MTKMPAPEQWVLHRMNEMEVAEMIERHIDYIDKGGRSVHLPTKFVRHYVQRDDGALPTVVAIATLPIVLADGVLLAPEGLDRKRGIVFKVAKELRELLREGESDDAAVREAMRFLCDNWLCDVATDYAGKCTIIAAALTVIERSLLPDRPAFFVTAGRRGGGKTTTLAMLIMAVTGIWPAAAAWSTNEEERRKALLSYFLSGVAYILWDNIERGSQISCPHIEKSCTSAFYSDRRLGVSEMVATAAATIHFFTGNNISPRGDLASRSLQVRLNVDRPDPENRTFKHPDPIGWTEANRGEILQALYHHPARQPHAQAAPRCGCPHPFQDVASPRRLGARACRGGVGRNARFSEAVSSAGRRGRRRQHVARRRPGGHAAAMERRVQGQRRRRSGQPRGRRRHPPR
jgi:hypothetical protein